MARDIFQVPLGERRWEWLAWAGYGIYTFFLMTIGPMLSPVSLLWLLWAPSHNGNWQKILNLDRFLRIKPNSTGHIATSHCQTNADWHIDNENLGDKLKWNLSQWVRLFFQENAFENVPGMLETFSPPPRVSYPDMHHGTWRTCHDVCRDR